MGLELQRVILFTRNLDGMGRFYAEVLGLELANTAPGWREYRAGGCAIALHEGESKAGSRPPKLAFYAADVAAVRATLTRRGAKMGKVVSAGSFNLCDGKDPDGNALQISSRK
ncbi:VOC family protein [Dongia sp.]|uniref:VOC family protein n=1 Tax=Dongia sp. TaxID=1977262 RepID=UPI0037538F13